MLAATVIAPCLRHFFAQDSIHEDYGSKPILNSPNAVPILTKEEAQYLNKLVSTKEYRDGVKSFPRLMSRQGEGYGFPDNSYQAIKMAIEDGFSKIRISISTTADNVIYCSHSYELENNSKLKRVTLDGVTYTQDIDITKTTSDFIDRICYKGYPIPTLDKVMSLLVQYPIEVTLELKNSFSDNQLKLLINKVNYYNMPVILSSEVKDIDRLTDFNANLNIGVIFHYTDTRASNIIKRYEKKYKTLRFDCFYEDEVSPEAISNIIHPDIKLKFGAQSPSIQELMELMQWVDVCEVPYRLSKIQDSQKEETNSSLSLNPECGESKQEPQEEEISPLPVH